MAWSWWQRNKYKVSETTACLGTMVAGAPPEAIFLAETPLRMLRSALFIGVYLGQIGGFLALSLSSPLLFFYYCKGHLQRGEF